MSGRHATSAELELYVLGALDPARVDEFEAHCAVCDHCAGALAREASLETVFEQVAHRAARAQAARPLRAFAYGAAGLLAAAAAIVLWLGRTTTATANDATAAAGVTHHAMDDGAILDARNDALDGG